MKHFVSVFVLVFLSLQLFAQSNIEEIVKEGIQLHDKGDYENAIKTYKKALDIDPKSELVNYEIAYSYFQNKNYDKALEYSSFVLDQKGNYAMPAILIKGSILDIQGKTNESIDMFKKAIDDFGESHLLDYNLALNYYNIKDYPNAELFVKKALELKPDHNNSLRLLKQLDSLKLLTSLPETADEFKESEPNLLNTISWLENTPIDKTDELRTKQLALLMAWLINTPSVTISVDIDVLPFTEKNPELLTIFMAGWAKYSINNSYSSDLIKCNLAGIQSAIEYYQKGNGLKSDKEMDKIVQLKNKNKLEDWLKNKLKKS